MERLPPFTSLKINVVLNLAVSKKKNIFPIWIKSKEMNNLIKQYSITKISSALGCGPKMKNDLGFDIVIFNNRFEYAMEKM